MTDGAAPASPVLTIGRADFQAVRNAPRFARRPYACLFLTRQGYPAVDDVLAALPGLGVRTMAFPVGTGESKGRFLDRLLGAILEFRPDFLLTLSHTGIDAEGTLAGLLAELRLPLASWLLDSPDLLLAPYPRAAGDAVVVFSCDAGALPGIARAGYRHVHSLPLAAAPGFLAARQTSRPDRPATDVLFVGENYVAETGRRLKAGRFDRELLANVRLLAERCIAAPTRDLADLFARGEAALGERYLSLAPARRRQDFALAMLCRANTLYRAAVLRRVAPLGLCVVGPESWSALLRGSSGWRRQPSVYDPAAVAALYRSATVTLNVTSVHMHGALNQRVFDVPAAGGFLLTDWSPQLAGLFEPGTEAATYDGPDDARETCARYLKDAEARTAVTAAARRRIESEHTYAHRLAAMLAVLKAWAAES